MNRQDSGKKKEKEKHISHERYVCCSSGRNPYQNNKENVIRTEHSRENVRNNLEKDKHEVSRKT